MPVVDRVIRPARPQDAGPTAAVSARAFAEDPLYVWIFPDERARDSRLPRLFTTRLRAALRGRDETDLMVDGERILGGAVWPPPGASRLRLALSRETAPKIGQTRHENALFA